MDDHIEVPQYFVCPISLQIMKDPVTVVTGITYDRKSIEHWLFTSQKTTCPVTKQPLPKDSHVTPNHTLQRLIEKWCADNTVSNPCIDQLVILKMIGDLRQEDVRVETLKKLELAAAEHERNRKCMVEAGLPKAILLFVQECFKNQKIEGLKEALSILRFVRVLTKDFLGENHGIIESLTWVLGCSTNDVHVNTKSHVVLALKGLLQEAESGVLERLNPDFFRRVIGVLREKMGRHGINAALEMLLQACPYGRNRLMMVECGGVFELIELELRSPDKKRTTELTLSVLFHLCCCADGRAEFLNHGAAIALISKRISRVSPAADDRAISILALICKFSGTSAVVQEMLEVKAVPKICMFLQMDCPTNLKDKAREILRAHSQEWKNSPCIHSLNSFSTQLGIS